MSEKFDSDGFYAALNAERLSRKMTWKEVAEEAGVNASTLTRMSQGNKPDVNGLAGLLRWSGLKAEMFMAGSDSVAARPIAEITALLRADPNLTPQNALVLEKILHTTYETLRNS